MSKLEMTQLERLREIGLYLQRIRQEQDLPLEEIASHTYIPLRILRAIEAGDDQILPEPIFIQGFIRRYADALGLDGQALSHEFPLYAQPLQSDCIDEEPLVNQPAPWQFPSFKFLKSTPTSSVAKPAPNWPLIAACALGAIALAGVFYGLSRSFAQPQDNQSATLPASPSPESVTPTPTSEPVDETASDAPQPSDAETPVALFAESTGQSLAVPGAATVEALTDEVSAPVQVSVQLERRSWMQITVDGVSEFEGIMDEGTEQTWLGEEQITVLAGDAGAVMLATNGAEPSVMGDDGSIAEMTITPEESDTP